jgi:hypothetical protein
MGSPRIQGLSRREPGGVSTVGIFAVADADDFNGILAGLTVDKAPGTHAETE